MSESIQEYKRDECPICRHVGWCGRRSDGLVLCKRPPMPREVYGFVFRGMGDDAVTGMYVEAGREHSVATTSSSSCSASSKSKQSPPPPKVDVAKIHRECVAALTSERRAALATILGLPETALSGLPIGWWSTRRRWNSETKQHEGEPGCWTSPECDSQGRIIGLGLRWPTGEKGQLAGGKRGLTLPEGWREQPDPVLAVEGASDVLAGRAVGLNVIGRPSNCGGADFIAHVCRDRRVIILGENDRKGDGTWPGREGAEAVASKLESDWGRPVPIAFPPDGTKDLRDWVRQLAPDLATADVEAVRAEIFASVQPPSIMFVAGPRSKRGRPRVRAYRWSDGAAAEPIHADLINIDDAVARRRYAKALTKVETDADVDDLAARLMALKVPTPAPKQTSRASGATEVPQPSSAASGPDNRPAVFLPGGSVSITECALQLGALLSQKGDHYFRGGAVVTIAQDDAGHPILQTTKPAALASVFESVAQLMEWGKVDGEVVPLPAVCTEQQAKLILNCDGFQQALPPLRLISRCNVLIERASELVQISGYDRESGIWVSGQSAQDVALNEAIELLGELLDDFRFATLADRARALAAFITPGLVLGGLLRGRAPVDLGEADDSQSGKGYRNKLTAAIYNHSVRAVTQKRGGVGSLEETFNTALIRGYNFISFDNVRGAIDSPALESFLTEDTYLARAPHLAAVEIDPRRVIVQLTSNRADITPDFANRCSCVRILKQPADYRFRKYPAGDVLDHVRAHQPRYLGAVFAVIRAWHAAGKPRTDDTRHDFRAWAQSLDWIAQTVLHAGPLLDGHRDTQVRMSTPNLNWLRDVALAVRRADRLDQWLRTHQILDVIADTSIKIPGLDEDADLEADDVRKKALQAIGFRLRSCFGSHNQRVVDGIEIEREDVQDPVQRRTNREYRFRLVQCAGQSCAYSPAHDARLGAESHSAVPDDVRPTKVEAALSTESDVCAYCPPSAPSAAPSRAPSGKAFAPSAPTGLIAGASNGVSTHVFENTCVDTRVCGKEIEPLGALGATSADSSGDDGGLEGRDDIPILDESGVAEPVKWYSGGTGNDVSVDVARLAERHDGWTPQSWRERLLYMAMCCEERHPERARELREAAGLMTSLGS